MYVEKVPNRKSPPAILIRESFRKDGKVKKRTIANITNLPEELILLITENIQGNKINRDEVFEVISSLQHGNIAAVKLAMQKLSISNLLSSQQSREKKIILSLICMRIIRPESKLATSDWWNNTTIKEEFGLEEDLNVDHIYKAMDWLLKSKTRIEKKLAKRHLDKKASHIMYDLSSSYFEGQNCPLARRGYSRDRKKGKLQVNYGLLTNQQGVPVSVDIFPGNTSDSKTFLSQAKKAREDYQIQKIVFIGDRGMIGQGAIDAMNKEKDMAWITALKAQTIKKLIKRGEIMLSAEDQEKEAENIFEIFHPDYPKERLIVCRNFPLAQHRRKTRENLIQKTEEDLEKIQIKIGEEKLSKESDIALKIGEVINKYKVKKYFNLKIEKNSFSYTKDQETIKEEKDLDGIYVIRTSLNKEEMKKEKVVRSYKDLSEVEIAFRSLKTEDLHIRPIYHYNADRVKAHIFLCMLSYYVTWHMKEILKPFLFADEELEKNKASSNPVKVVKRSDKAKQKDSMRVNRVDGETIPVRKWPALLENLSTIQRNECRYKDFSKKRASFFLDTKKSSYQEKVFQHLKKISLPER